MGGSKAACEGGTGGQGGTGGPGGHSLAVAFTVVAPTQAGATTATPGTAGLGGPGGSGDVSMNPGADGVAAAEQELP